MSSPPAASENFSSHYFSVQSPDRIAGKRSASTITLAGLSLQMCSGEGVFSKKGLDAGSRLLLETIFQAADFKKVLRIADLGCGWGPIGCFLAARYPTSEILMADINANAAALAGENARLNQLTNARAWCGDALTAARGEYFQVVACNPPIRAGNATIGRMFEDAYRCLSAGGTLWIVIRTAQGAKSWQKRLTELFGNCETISIESGYRIFRCVK